MIGAGCSEIQKLAIEALLTAFVVAQLLTQAGMPGGVVKVVSSKRSARWSKLTLTGSTQVGHTLLASTARTFV